MKRLVVVLAVLLFAVPAAANITNFMIRSFGSSEAPVPCRPGIIVQLTEDSGAGACDVEAAGTANSICICNDAGDGYTASGGSSGFGVSGTTGTDATLAALKGLTSFQTAGDGPQAYFSSSIAGGILVQGSDANTCTTILSPCLSFTKMLQVCVFARCNLDDGDAPWLAIAVTDQLDLNYPIGAARRPVLDVRSMTPGRPVTIDANLATALIVFHLTGDGGTEDVAGGQAYFQDLIFTNIRQSLFAIDDFFQLFTNRVHGFMLLGSAGNMYQSPGGQIFALNGSCFTLAARPCIHVNEFGSFVGVNLAGGGAPISAGGFAQAFCDSNPVSARGYCSLWLIDSTMRFDSDGTATPGLISLANNNASNGTRARFIRVQPYGANHANGATLVTWKNQTATNWVDQAWYQSTIRDARSAFTSSSEGYCNELDRFRVEYSILEIPAATGNSLFTDQHTGLGGLGPFGAGNCAGAQYVMANNIVHEHGGTKTNLFRLRDSTNTSNSYATGVALQAGLISDADFTANYDAAFADFMAAGRNTIVTTTQFEPHVCTSDVLTGTAEAATTVNQITDTGAFPATVNALVGFTVRVRSGTGAGNVRQITASTANTIDVGVPFSAEPDSAVFDVSPGQPCPCARGAECFEALQAEYTVEQDPPLPLLGLLGVDAEITSWRLGQTSKNYGSH